MNRTYKILIILLTAFFLLGLLLFASLNIGLTASKRLAESESRLTPYRNHLFKQLDLGYELDTSFFNDLETNASAGVEGFNGYKVLIHNSTLFSSPADEQWESSDWRRSRILEQSVIHTRGTEAAFTFINSNTGHRLIFRISLVDRELIEHSLVVMMIGLILYLTVLVIFLLVILFSARKEEKRVDTAESPEENFGIGQHSKEGEKREFILSLNCLQKFDNFIKETSAKYLPYSVAVLRIDQDHFDEDLHEDGFELLRTHLKFNNGYYEYDERQMVLLLPDTNLTESIKLLEEFTARLIEDNINVNIHGGVTSMNGRVVTSAVMLIEAEMALDKAISDSENMIIGFNPDPDRYRDYMTQKR